MISINYNNKDYIEGSYILNNAPNYSKGCRGTRDLIKKKDIDTIKYIFARLKEDKWLVTDGKSVKYDKVFFKKTFIYSIPELKNDNNKKTITDDNSIQKAPEIINLNDSEKFKDENGNIIDIETRGERSVDKIYFRVKDVMNGFQMDRLDDVITDKRVKDGHTKGIHYELFICKKSDEPVKNKISKPELFLTYEGLLRVLFVSRSPKVKPFIKWATETLFTAQLGTIEQKQELVSTILGTNAKVIKEVFNADRNTLPCVYLFTLNTVGNLRESMNIDPKYSDDSIVAKYGFTKDLARRTGEHINKYNKINGVNLKLKYYSYVDPQYMSNAETDIKDYMIGFETKIDFEKEDELVIIPIKLLKMVERQYELIGKSYMGHISELITKIKELEDKSDKDKLNFQIELQNEKYKNELLHRPKRKMRQKRSYDLYIL